MFKRAKEDIDLGFDDHAKDQISLIKYNLKELEKNILTASRLHENDSDL